MNLLIFCFTHQLEKWLKQIDGDGENRGGIVFCCHLVNGLEISKLKPDGVFAQDFTRLTQFCCRLKFTLGIDNLGSTVPLSLCLARHGPLHLLGQVNMLKLNLGVDLAELHTLHKLLHVVPDIAFTPRIPQ
jgi:hypothetical protein